ncbi:MAG TPA: hypothetical protein PLX71_09820 [Phycicoccus sp.]|nr:hypothetical protein [Phycicoccus sp.]
MPGTFTVDTDHLRHQAGEMDSLASSVDACRGALTTAVSTDAFGIICRFLAGPVNQAGPHAVAGIDGLSEALKWVSGGMTSMAATYDLNDLLAQFTIGKAGAGR